MTNPTPINAKAIIARLGGRTVLWRRLKAAGVDVSIKTIESWQSRGTIPTKRLAQLVGLAAKLGLNLNLNDYLNQQND